MAQDSKSFSQEESEESRGHNPIHKTLLWLAEHHGCVCSRENPQHTQSQPQHQPVGSLEGEEAAQEDTVPAQALPHCLPSRATAAPALLQVPMSAQAEDALLSTVVPPLSSLNFGWIV